MQINQHNYVEGSKEEFADVDGLAQVVIRIFSLLCKSNESVP
jgi:hypothetical protein